MKTLLATVAATFVATAAMAEDGLSFGGEVKGEANFTTEAETITLTPEMTYGISGFDLTASTDLTLYNDEFVISDTLDTRPTLDLEVSYFLREDTELTLGTSYDFETETRGDIIGAVTFKF